MIGVEVDVLATEQFLLQSTSSPEKRLALAVLRDALSLWTKFLVRFTKVPNQQEQQAFRALEDWFYEEDDSWVFSCWSICAVLKIDHQSLLSELKRRERYFRETGVMLEFQKRSRVAGSRTLIVGSKHCARRFRDNKGYTRTTPVKRLRKCLCCFHQDVFCPESGFCCSCQTAFMNKKREWDKDEDLRDCLTPRLYANLVNGGHSYYQEGWSKEDDDMI